MSVDQAARRRPVLRILFAASALATTVAAGGAGPAPAAAAKTRPGGCQVQRLPEPALPGLSAVDGGDPSGRYLIGARWTSPEEPHPLLWIDGQLQDFRTPYHNPMIMDVNASGVLVGNETASFQPAWRYENGRFTTLPGLSPGHRTSAIAINARGDILGGSVDPVHPFDGHLVVWPAGALSTPRELIPPDATSRDVYAVDIDDDGTVVGGSHSPSSVGYIWPRGGTARLLCGPSGERYMYVWKIRRGWIATSLFAPGGEAPTAWRVHGGPVNMIGAPGRAHAVNRHGDMAVSTNGPLAIAHRDGRIVPLPGGVGEFDLSGVRTLSDDGVAAGWIFDGQRGHPVVWRGC